MLLHEISTIVKMEHINKRFLFNAVIYSCQDQGKIMHTLPENCSYMSMFSQKLCKMEEFSNRVL